MEELLLELMATIRREEAFSQRLHEPVRMQMNASCDDEPGADSAGDGLFVGSFSGLWADGSEDQVGGVSAASGFHDEPDQEACEPTFGAEWLSRLVLLPLIPKGRMALVLPPVSKGSWGEQQWRETYCERPVCLLDCLAWVRLVWDPGG